MMSEADVRALTVPFSEEELALLAERAAAHSMPVLDFVRACALTRATPLEAPSAAPPDEEG